MKHLILLSIFLTLSFSCGGTCIECHPKLKPIINDKDHTILNQCITCHNKPVVHGNACGQDCFTCHEKQKLYSDASVSEHQSLQKCTVCHNDEILAKKAASKPKPLIDIFSQKEGK